MRLIIPSAVALIALAGVATCSSGGQPPPKVEDPEPIAEKFEATLPRAPGDFGPSLMALGPTLPAGHEIVNGDMLSDVDTCSTCHPDIANQWGASAHSFASFNNPIYRVNVELARQELGKEQSQHCGGCHDVSLQVDGLMLGEVPAEDLRSHSGVTCRLCHGIDSVTSDGNGSYVLSRQPLSSPNPDDQASIAAHRADVTVKPLGAELCVGCHRGFLSPDLGLPVHMAGIDEPTFWRSSAYTGNGVGRVDKVEKQTCIDCHMAKEDASVDEVSAHDGKVASHRFLGGHSWMAGMRGDKDQLARLQAKLEGVASIDVAAALIHDPAAAPASSSAAGQWHLPADGAPVIPGTELSFDVVIRNLLVGHRFPGGVMDVQDTWIEVDVRDARGALLASSGQAHERDVEDDEAHVLRAYVVNEAGEILEEHELPRFRGTIANHTVAARDAAAIRYAFAVPKKLAAGQLPLQVDARLRHRSRTLRFQREVCDTARTAQGKAFLEGTKAARDADLDPCRAQPITEIAKTRVYLGTGWEPAQAKADASSARAPAWVRLYEHGMALLPVVTERLDEPRAVLEAALLLVPEGEPGIKPRAMILTQLGSVAAKQGRTDDALALIAEARGLIGDPYPPALDFIAADALARVWRWDEAADFAAKAAEKAPLNTAAWVMLARARGSLGDDRGALAAARAGLAVAPRDPDLLRTQATSLRSLDTNLADRALAAFDRFRAPDGLSALRMACAAASARCAREREAGHTHQLQPR